MNARRRPVAGVVLVACLAVTALGCSDVSTAQRDQQDVLRYEEQIGALNTQTATPTATPQGVQVRLEQAVRRYRDLDAPGLMRPVHRRLLRALRAELASVRRGLRATAAGDGAGIRKATSDNRRAQRSVTAAIATITAQASKCRAALQACSAPATGSSTSP